MYRDNISLQVAYRVMVIPYFSTVPSLPPPIILVQSTSFTSVMALWKAIPENYVHGILKGYVVKLTHPNGNVENSYGCTKSSITVRRLEKSTVYKVKIAGYTSKGHGNFSEDFMVITNIEGMHSYYSRSIVFPIVSLYKRIQLNALQWPT